MTADRNIERIEFCDFLRSASIIVVMLSHYLIGFNELDGWLYNPNKVLLYEGFIDYFKWLDGAYGVSLFFLISGFLIPISLNRYGSKGFLIQRLFRLVPTYAFSLLIVVLVSLHFGTLSLSLNLIKNYFYNITMNRDIIGGAILDSVIWTLEIEMKFYFYIAVLFSLLRCKVHVLPWANIGFMTLVILLSYDISPKYIGVISFMFVGVSLYVFAYEKHEKRLWAILAIPFNLFLFHYNFYLVYQSLYVIGIYYTSLIFFIISMMFFYKFSLTASNPIKYIANISYPLYAVHSIGYALISWLAYECSLGVLALPITISVVVAICHFLHKEVEIKSISFGKYLSMNNRVIYEKD